MSGSTARRHRDVERCIDHEPTNQLLTAWIAKEKLRALLACATRGGVRHDIAHRLTHFYTWCADIPELTTLAETVAAWWPQILNFLQLKVTNSRTEKHQPADQGRRPRDVRLPQSPQPTPAGTLRLHSPSTPGGRGIKINPP
jgi:hypothetical protein